MKTKPRSLYLCIEYLDHKFHLLAHDKWHHICQSDAFQDKVQLFTSLFVQDLLQDRVQLFTSLFVQDLLQDEVQLVTSLFVQDLLKSRVIAALVPFVQLL